MSYVNAVERALLRLEEYATKYYQHTSMAHDITFLLADLKTHRDQNASLSGQLERLVDRYNTQSKTVEALDAQVKALGTIASLRALKRAA